MPSLTGKGDTGDFLPERLRAINSYLVIGLQRQAGQADEYYRRRIVEDELSERQRVDSDIMSSSVYKAISLLIR